MRANARFFIGFSLMTTTKFTTRASKSITKLLDDKDLSLIPTRSQCLYSPVQRGDHYVWIKLMDSDGTLVGPRLVTDGEGASPDSLVDLLIGVVIQCEDSTSQTKPNPIGKAAIEHARNGVWVDLLGEGRRRLDRVHVLMVLPKGAAHGEKRKFATAKRNVTNAADLMPDCESLEVPRGISSDKLAKEVKKKIRAWFKGRGRPRIN